MWRTLWIAASVFLLQSAVLVASSRPDLVGEFADDTDSEPDSVVLSVTVKLQSDGTLSLTLMAGYPDGHGAAPDGSGEGHVDSSGILHFSYEDSFSNKGDGTFRRTKKGYLLSIHISDVEDSRCLPFYGEHTLQRRSHKKGPTRPSGETRTLLKRRFADLVSR
jgi:hypothetical protein